MPDLVYEPEIEEGWEAQGELIPQTERRARSLNIFGSKFLDRLLYIFTRRIKDTKDALVTRALWTDLSHEDCLYVPEGAHERPPQRGIIRGQYGLILRKDSPVDEPAYFSTRAKFLDGAVRLKLTAEGNTPGDAVLAVGMAESLTGPWTYFYGASPWTFNPNEPLQIYEIPTTTLTLGKTYYYKIVRQRTASGDTLPAPVLLAGIQTR